MIDILLVISICIIGILILYLNNEELKRLTLELLSAEENADSFAEKYKVLERKYYSVIRNLNSLETFIEERVKLEDKYETKLKECYTDVAAFLRTLQQEHPPIAEKLTFIIEKLEQNTLKSRSIKPPRKCRLGKPKKFYKIK